MIYIILPKLGEAPDWGFSADEILVVLTAAAKARYSKAHFKKYMEGEGSVLSLPNDGIICYSDDFASVEVRPLYRKLLHSLLPSERRVFRHFGGDPLRNMSAATMKAKMKDPHDRFWDERHVMPFSEKGGSDASFKWLSLVRKVRDSCFKGFTLSVDGAISKLDEAWALADGYFNSQVPMRTMLETLFPLYLTLSGSESDEDKMATMQAVKLLIEDKAFDPIKTGIEANVGEADKGMRLSRSFTLPSSPDQFPEFLGWFSELSKAYTEKLGLADNADPLETTSDAPLP
jgi:hypothetical protein